MTTSVEFPNEFRGQIVKPGDPNYDAVRKVHNGLIDKRPAVIARCVGLADIADAIRYATAQKLEISVRGGGHNVGGRAVSEGGLMIDLSLMKGVHTNARDRIAVVEGGALWKDLNRETQLHGLAVTGGVVGTTGVAGLTLGGGLGWLLPKHGLALDNLLAVNLVLADGTVVRASDQEHPDLFWAVRGGGGNFGVAGSFEFNLHPVGPLVMGGLVAFPFLEAGKVLRAWRDMTRTASDDLMMVAALLSAPDGSGNKIIGIAACHCGAKTEAEAALARLQSFGTVVMNALGPIPYTALNGMLDAGYPSGALNYWKSGFIPTLSDEAIDAAVTAHAGCPVPTSQILFEHFHGAATRISAETTAYALRDPGYNTLVLGQWMDPADGTRTTAWVRESFESLRAHFGQNRYVNYLGPDDGGDVAGIAAYGANLPRLRRLKKQYDPQNIFHLNVNVVPE